MSTEITTESIFWEVATTLASQQKVFVTSGSQAPYEELLANDAKELVCLDENCSIDGVKVRKNYKERPNSKDLIIDISGDISLEQVAKVLKKHGAFLSLVPRDWAEYFGEVKAVAWSETMSDENGSEFQRLEYVNAKHEDILFWVVASHTIPDLPVIEQEFESDETDHEALQAALAEIEELKLQLVKVDRLKRSNQTRVSNLKASFDAQSIELNTAQEERNTLKTELKSLKRKVNAAEKSKEKHNLLKQDFEKVQSDLEQTRESLIVREGEFAKSEANLKRETENVQSLNTELKTAKSEQSKLNKTLRKTQKNLALNVEQAEALKQSEANLSEAQEAFKVVATAWSDWLAQGFDGDLPPSPAPQADLARLWSRQLTAHQGLVTGNFDEQAELLSLRAKVKALESDLTLSTQERDEARSSLNHLQERAIISDDSLRDSLKIERALRKAQEQELVETEALVAQQNEQIQSLVNELDESKRILITFQNPEAQEDPQVNKLKAHIKVQKQQRQARERLLSINHELQIQLTTALEDEIVARADLERRLELAEAQLRKLKADQDFPNLHEPRPRREQRPTRQQQSHQETKGSRTERLSALGKQLKSKAHHQNERSETQQAQVPKAASRIPNKRKSNKSEQKRLRVLADRLKSQHADRDAEAPVRAASHGNKVSPILPNFSNEELQEQTERAENILKTRLKKLSRNRK